jgi:hypothetical protein
MEMVERRLEIKNQKPAGTGWIRRVFGPRRLNLLCKILDDKLYILYLYEIMEKMKD